MSSTNKKIKLSEEEKHYISRIANTTGLDEKTVKQVFLSLLTCITLDMYNKLKEDSLVEELVMYPTEQTMNENFSGTKQKTYLKG